MESCNDWQSNFVVVYTDNTTKGFHSLTPDTCSGYAEKYTGKQVKEVHLYEPAKEILDRIGIEYTEMCG